MKTLYIFFCVKMFFWCFLMAVFQQHFGTVNPLFDYYRIPFLQWIMFLTGGVGLANLWWKRIGITKIVVLITFLVWNYAVIGFIATDWHHPNWIRVLIEAVFVGYMFHKIVFRHDFKM